MTDSTVVTGHSGWLLDDDCDLDDLVRLVERTTDIAAYPFASSVAGNAVVYDAPALAADLADPVQRSRVQAEWADAMLHGPGVIVLRGAFADAAIVDRATAAFDAMIADQRAGGVQSGDHFAAPGANDRIWNALEKFAVADPAGFADYYANDVLAAVCAAWLGPGYQMTSQVNVVNPGGAAQSPHVDYHLGFQSNEVASRYPAHVHSVSPMLTLQGAIAHCDMPVESGPTMYLPHSQKLPTAYLAWRRPEFREYFDANHVQLPLSTGDAVFFDPALMHAAGHNRSADIRRMANLLQVSSAFGRAMESVDRQSMVAALHPELARRRALGADEVGLRNVVAASAEGYPFPTNLDRDPPLDGLAPPSQADLAWRAIDEQWSPTQLAEALEAAATRRRTHD